MGMRNFMVIFAFLAVSAPLFGAPSAYANAVSSEEKIRFLKAALPKLVLTKGLKFVENSIDISTTQAVPGLIANMLTSMNLSDVDVDTITFLVRNEASGQIYHGFLYLHSERFSKDQVAILSTKNEIFFSCDLFSYNGNYYTNSKGAAANCSDAPSPHTFSKDLIKQGDVFAFTLFSALDIEFIVKSPEDKTANLHLEILK